MKKIFVLLLLTILISGCANSIPEEKIKKCETDSECILVDTISGLDYIPNISDTCGCQCTTAINKEYLELWEQKSRELDGKLKCDILCKTCIIHTKAICVNNTCAPR